MIGQLITDPETGEPILATKLSKSTYQPPKEIVDLYTRCQQDYQTAWALQHRSFDEFDGMSLLDRTRLDQETFGTYVGNEWMPKEKRWRWKGRKSTSRNKIIGILAHLIAGMLYPFVYAKDETGEEDKLTASVMRILVEDALRKAGYEIKFMHMVLASLVSPAVIVNVEWVQAMITVKQKLADGTYSRKEVVDELISGLNLNILPVDEVMLLDFYTNDIQRQTCIPRVRRISYDEARAKYANKYFQDGKDLFDYVQKGMTRVMIAESEGSTLYDIDWTEADANFVQELTFYYRTEDLEVTFVGGVFMGNMNDVYNSNPFKHRRFTLVGDEWCTIPVYPFAKSGFEPIDPTGRFAYYKSAANKEYWDDRTLNRMSQLAIDGTVMSVIAPAFFSGAGKVDDFVMAPGASVGMPANATVSFPGQNTNLQAAYNAIDMQRRDLSESTQDPTQSGQAEKGVTATAAIKAEQNARIFLGVAGQMIADLVTKTGQLVLDLVVSHATQGELDASAPEALKMKYKTHLIKGKNKNRDMSHKVIFTDEFMGKTLSKEEVEKTSWELYDETGDTPEAREQSDKRIYKVNPYQFVRNFFSLYVDPDMIVRKSTGLDRAEKLTAFNIMTDPRVVPFTDQKAVIDDFAIEEYGGSDPERYKKKEGAPDDMAAMSQMLGQKSPPVNPQGGISPMQTNSPLNTLI